MRLTSSFQAPPLTPCNVELQPQECFAVEHLTQFCDGLVQQPPHSLHSVLNSLALIAPLLNAIPNVVFLSRMRRPAICWPISPWPNVVVLKR